MTLIKDLIEIPERVQKGGFVLKLTEGVTRADATLRDYVVTPELKAASTAPSTSPPKPRKRKASENDVLKPIRHNRLNHRQPPYGTARNPQIPTH